MKTIFLLLMFFATKATLAQKLTEAQVPAAAKNTFSKAHSKAAGHWEREGANYEVNFKEGGKSMSCVINKNGTIQETETDITVNELPKAVQTYVAQHYKSSSINAAAHIVKAGGEILYEAVVNGRDLLFKEDGTFVKSVKD